MAKKQKPKGRVNMDDIKRAAKMLGQTSKAVRKPFGGKNLRRAAKKMRKMM